MGLLHTFTDRSNCFHFRYYSLSVSVYASMTVTKGGFREVRLKMFRECFVISSLRLFSSRRSLWWVTCSCRFSEWQSWGKTVRGLFVKRCLHVSKTESSGQVFLEHSLSFKLFSSASHLQFQSPAKRLKDIRVVGWRQCCGWTSGFTAFARSSMQEKPVVWIAVWNKWSEIT